MAKRYSPPEFSHPSNSASVKVNQHSDRFPSVRRRRLKHRGAAARHATAFSARGE